MKKGEEITLGELSIMAAIYLADIVSVSYFSKLNPGWGMIASWPWKAWALGVLSVALSIGFLLALYRFYFRKTYGKWALFFLLAFIALHLALAACLTFFS